MRHRRQGGGVPTSTPLEATSFDDVDQTKKYHLSNTEQFAEVNLSSSVNSGNNNNNGKNNIMMQADTTSNGVATFDTCKREATKLERQLEEKISKYQQLAHRYTTVSSSQQNSHSSSNGSSNSWNRMELGDGPGGGKSDNIDTLNAEEASLRHDIQRSLQNLQDWISNKLVPVAETSHQKHIVKRYREIWLDSSQDFEKSCSMIQRHKDRYELFSKSSSGISDDGADGDQSMNNLLRERNHIQNSLNATHSILAQASSIKEDLRTQGLSLTGIRGAVGNIMSNVPGINTLIEKIRRKRSRDDYILSFVIASCVLFILWYLFS